MLVFIIACEVLFWVFVLAGLVCRYMLRLPRTGAALLICTPLIDLALLAAAVLHLRSGAEASLVHGLAAIYIGVSVAFGHSMIRWADVRFAQRFAGGPAPTKQPRWGKEHAKRERSGWYRHLAAWMIGCGVLYILIKLVGEPERTADLLQIIQWWSIVLGIDFLISFSYTLWPKEEKKGVSH